MSFTLITHTHTHTYTHVHTHIHTQHTHTDTNAGMRYFRHIYKREAYLAAASRAVDIHT